MWSDQQVELATAIVSTGIGALVGAWFTWFMFPERVSPLAGGFIGYGLVAIAYFLVVWYMNREANKRSEE